MGLVRLGCHKRTGAGPDRQVYILDMDASDVSRWLNDRYERSDLVATEVGAGAWSTAYGYSLDGHDLVIRVGQHVADFETDRLAAEFSTDGLPIPCVHDVGRVDDSRFFCISDFAPGVPLESLDMTVWLAVVPSVADALETMRSIRAPAGSMTWHRFLCSVEVEDAASRGAGWSGKMGRSDRTTRAFADAMSALRSLDVGDVPLTLVHGDLINRNVHVADASITGLFDWGCMKWGDHLYDLAWFEFWSPWYPEHDFAVLSAELDSRWARDGWIIERRDDRRRACLTHIALEHLIYNTVIDSSTGVDEVIGRMDDLDLR